MAGKIFWKKYRRIILATVSLLIMAGMAFFLVLPAVATRFILPRLVPTPEDVPFSGKISAIGPFQTVAGPLVWGPPDNPSFSIGTVRIDYTPASLVQKKIRRVTISDVVVTVCPTPGKMESPKIGSMPIFGKPDPDSPTTVFITTKPAAVIMMETRIRNAVLIVEQDDASPFRIPFELDLVPDGPDLTRAITQLRVFPRDQALTLQARITFDGPGAERQYADIQIDGQDIALDAFSDLIRQRVPDLDISGRVTLSASARLNWFFLPVTFSQLHANLTWRQGHLKYPNVAFSPDPETGSAMVTISSDNAERWQLEASGLQVNTALPLKVEQVSAVMGLVEDQWSLAGTAHVTGLPGAVGKTGLAVEKPLEMAVDFFLHEDANTLIGHAAWTMATKAGELRMNMDMDSAAIQFPTITGKGTARVHLQDPIRLQNAAADFQVPNFSLSHPTLSGNLETFEVSAEFSAPPSGNTDAFPAAHARLQASGGFLNHPAGEIRVSEIRLDTPIPPGFFADGLSTAPESGTFSVSRIALKDRPLASVNGRLTLTPSAITLAADVAASDFKGMTARLNATVQTTAEAPGHTDLEAILPIYAVPVTDLGQWLPAARGVKASGRVSAHAAWSLRGNQISGSLDAEVMDGKITAEKRGMEISGIHTRIQVPDLPHIRTAPAQSLQFSSMTMGALGIDGGRIDFQVESPDTLFIEKGEFSWCDGKVDVSSLRITAGRDEYAASLYCQRVSLSRVLDQFGSVSAKGTGTLNGRLPISWENGKIRVDDGFLFSTPGEDGKIQITGTDALMAGIPAGTPRFGEMDLAREALKDYVYTWAKLGLTSEQDDLILRLQFDGKPVSPLPFVYKKELGGFIRVGIESQGSVFQGIGLDINLRLPLNQILKYTDVAQKGTGK